jgi:hypothetical protein
MSWLLLLLLLLLLLRRPTPDVVHCARSLARNLALKHQHASRDVSLSRRGTCAAAILSFPFPCSAFSHHTLRLAVVHASRPSQSDTSPAITSYQPSTFAFPFPRAYPSAASSAQTSIPRPTSTTHHLLPSPRRPACFQLVLAVCSTNCCSLPPPAQELGRATASYSTSADSYAPRDSLHTRPSNPRATELPSRFRHEHYS